MENDELEQLFKKLKPESKRPPDPDEPPNDKAPRRAFAYLKKALPFVLAIAFLLLAFHKNSPAATLTHAPQPDLLALVPMIAIPPKQAIPVSILRVVAIDPKILSKAQLQSLVLEHDLDGLADKIRTKKTLPPGRPIFWKDLELEPKKTQTVSPMVIFAKESS